MKRILAVMIGLCAMSSLWALDKVPLPIGPEMVAIPAGTFEMGSNDGESDEKPVKSWKIGEFYMSKYETTFEEYDVFVTATGREKPKEILHWADPTAKAAIFGQMANATTVNFSTDA